MKRTKTLLMYALWVILFFILSDFLINVGLNAAYKPIERKDTMTQVNVYQAEATLVNGRIRGLITNSQPDNVSGKYLEIDFYSKRDVFLGRKSIPINQLQENETQNFEVLFKLQDVKYYTVNIVDEKTQTEEIETILDEMTKPQILLATAIALLIFWP